MFEDTIVAIATGNETSAISVIRMSGDKVFDVMKKIFTKDLSDAPGYTIHYGDIVNPESGEVVDEVLVSVFRNPKSYTGEDVIEISCHGGVFVTREVLTTIMSQGVRMANPGEFTMRAYLNGKMDLTEAEAVNDVIMANHVDQLSLASQELKGSVKKVLGPLMEEMIEVIGQIEVNIDYPEYEDVEVLSNEVVYPKVKKWISDAKEILEKSYRGKLVRSGVSTAIVGKTNAGKSSLFNALLEEEKAIVTNIPGTTRDVVEGEIRLKNIVLKLQDTAGLRDSDDVVENIGIDKTKKTMQDAELVIVVLDGSHDLDEEEKELLKMTEEMNRIVVFNKADLVDEEGEGIWICAKEGKIEPLIQAIESKYEEVHEVIHHPALSNERQIGLLKSAIESLENAKEALEENRELDLVTVDLNSAHQSLREIEGSFTKEDLYDEIFSRFCLGK